jgi:nucleoside-diphosphate-sugar epimerase
MQGHGNCVPNGNATHWALFPDAPIFAGRRAVIRRKAAVSGAICTGVARLQSGATNGGQTMHVLITGAAGMLGARLAAHLATRGQVAGQPITRMTLVDAVTPPVPGGAPQGQAVACDIAAQGVAAQVVAGRPDVIYHLAAVVSGEAEVDFDKGYTVNFDATRALFDAVRAAAYRPRVVFASSIAVFGAPFPAVIGDEYFATPRTSYGTQKAMAELLLNDYSRRGFMEGIALRLPTICIRPGAPNRAASGFFSNILREPLVGQPAVLPVPDTVRHWFASPQSAVGFMDHAAGLDRAALGEWRVLNMPGLSATVADQIEALRRVAGQKAVDLIRREPDAAIASIVAGWPSDFDTARARALGFVAETRFDQIIEAHLRG